MRANIFLGSNEIESEEYIDIKSPFSGEVVSKYAFTSVEQVLQALQIAKSATKQAKDSLLSQRIAWLRDVVEQLREQKEDLAKTISDEVGKTISFSRIEVDRCIETIELSITAMTELNGEVFNTDAMNSGQKTLSFYTRVPVGVVVAITPFNFPLNLIAHKIAPALICGNSVVLKPTPDAPLTAYKFAKMFISSKYATKDALSVVYGDKEVGETLVKSDIPRVISFTGSVPVGNAITKNAGIKKLCLELGGNAATFIDKTADIDKAANICANASFYNSGQVCISLQRIYIHEDIYEKFSQKISHYTSKLKVGNPYENDTFVGPLINQDALLRAKNWVQSAVNEGAKVVRGNKSEDLVFYPTILKDVLEDMKIVCEEVFAPIVSLVKVKDFNQALEKINNTPYGLQYSIFTNDLNLTKQAIEKFECGGVVINDSPTKRYDIQPYGGIKQSGLGKEGPKYVIEEMSEIKSVVIS
jgi:acyl-CoA reductase-like NAD-dependent aldehyde dehydrogenase